MRIERKYYDKSKKELDKIIKITALEESLSSKQKSSIKTEKEIIPFKKETLSSEGKSRIKQDHNLEIEHILKEYKNKFGNLKRVPDSAKIADFNKLAEKALYAAQLMEYNAVAEIENHMLGRIIFESDFTWISSELNSHIKTIFSQLFSEADDVLINSLSGLFRIEFLYELYNEI